MIAYDRTLLQDYERASRYEWMDTNELGGYAASTIVGAHTRRYHGLLVAASVPAKGARVLLSKLEETIFVGGERIELGCNQYPGVIQPRGHDKLIRFRLDPWPVFTYQWGKIQVEKSVCLLHDQNTTVVTYIVTDAPTPMGIEIRPLIAGREIQSLHYDNPHFRTVREVGPDWLAMEPYNASSRLVIQHEPATFQVDGIWYYRFEYPRELEQGREGHEDLYTPGILVYTLLPGQPFHIVAKTEPAEDFHPESLLADERAWREALPPQAEPVSLVSTDKENWARKVRALGWQVGAPERTR